MCSDGKLRTTIVWSMIISWSLLCDVHACCMSWRANTHDADTRSSASTTAVTRLVVAGTSDSCGVNPGWQVQSELEESLHTNQVWGLTCKRLWEEGDIVGINLAINPAPPWNQLPQISTNTPGGRREQSLMPQEERIYCLPLSSYEFNNIAPLPDTVISGGFFPLVFFWLRVL